MGEWGDGWVMVSACFDTCWPVYCVHYCTQPPIVLPGERLTHYSPKKR